MATKKVQDEPVAAAQSVAGIAAGNGSTEAVAANNAGAIPSETTTTVAASTTAPKNAASSAPAPPPAKAEAVAAVVEDEEEEEEEEDEEGIIDDAVFDQLLELDDEDDNHEFSKSIVINFFEQARSTFEQMDAAIKDQDLNAYAKLGHFLKGSSATLGLQKVMSTCEKIQHSQASADEASLPEIDGSTALARGTELLARLKLEYEQAERHLCRFYEMDAPDFHATNASTE